MKPSKVLALTAVFAAAVTFVLVPSQVAQSQQAAAPATEAPTGFDGRDNGFLAEFCANQADLARVSVLSPADSAGRMQHGSRRRRVRRPRSRRSTGWGRSSTPRLR